MRKALFALAKTPLGELIIGIAFGTFHGLLPLDRIKETEKVLAFWHPQPFWEEHILIVPKKAIKSLSAMCHDDLPYITEVFKVAREIALEKGWDQSDYTIVTNGGSRQDVAQLHFHLGRGPSATPHD